MENTVLTLDFKRKLALECYQDPVLYCKTFLNHWFSGPIPWVHRGILALLLRRTDFLLKYGDMEKILKHFVYKTNPMLKDSPTKPIFSIHECDGKTTVRMETHKRVLIMMPRGMSKTTLANAANHYLITYMDCMFPVYVSEAGPHAEMQLGNVKREFETNTLHREVFGNKVPNRQDSEKWTNSQITTTEGVTVIARGRQAQIRGLNYNANRPDRFIIDDVEDKESVSTPEQITKTRAWFFSDVVPALDRMKGNGSMIVLGTLLHQDALLMHLMRDPRWTAIRFSAVDLDGEALWGANLSLEQLEQEKTSYALAGRLGDFYMEFMSELRDSNTAPFKPEFIRYGTPVLDDIAATAVAIDPAISKRTTADDCAFAVASITTKGKIFIREVTGSVGMSPREQIDEYFRLCKLYQPQRHGVESVAYQAALTFLLTEEMFRQNYYFEPIPITHSAKKTERILGVLQPRYASGHVFHERIFPKLEKELLDFPNGKDNYPDVVAMAIALLDPYAAQAADPDSDLGNDTYKPLEEELGDDYLTAV